MRWKSLFSAVLGSTQRQAIWKLHIGDVIKIVKTPQTPSFGPEPFFHQSSLMVLIVLGKEPLHSGWLSSVPPTYLPESLVPIRACGNFFLWR